jgi:hydrogenase/urease accessory protein HupE
MSNAIRLSRVPAVSFAVSALLFSTMPAHAHLNSTGMGPAYDGIVHFFMSPEDIAAVLALALFSGLRGPEFSRRTLFVLPFAWFAGGIVGLFSSTWSGNGALSALWLLLLGGLLAFNARTSLKLLTALAALLGVYHGYTNGAGMGDPATAVVALVGLAFAVFALIALVSAFVVRLQAGWARIAVRVAGSWIAASGLLMLGWAARAHR